MNRDIFEADGSTKLDFSGRSQVTLVDPEAIVQRGLIIRIDRPPPLAAERIDGCCVNGRPPGKRAQSLRALLRNSKIERENVRLVSLVGDTATAGAIEASSLKAMNVASKDGKIPSEADIEAIFSSNKGEGYCCAWPRREWPVRHA